MNTQLQIQPRRWLGFITVLFSLLLALAGTPAMAAPPVGAWAVSGKLKIVMDFPGIITTNMGLETSALGMKLSYGEDGTFSSSLLGMEGTWTSSGKKVNLDLTSWLTAMKDSITGILPEGTSVQTQKSSFTATVISPTSMKGKIALMFTAKMPAGASLGGVKLSSAVNGTISISGNLTNTPASAKAEISGGDNGSATMPIDTLNQILQAVSFYQKLTK